MSSSTIRRTGAALGFGVAFLVMASVFAPPWSTAGSTEPGAIIDPTTIPVPPNHDAADSGSTDPHEGLRSLGSIEGMKHQVRIYATPLGPRYSILSLDGRQQIATLLSAEDVARFYPEFDLRDLQLDPGSADDPGPLMLADPADSPLDH